MNGYIYNVNLTKKKEIQKKYIKSNKGILALSYAILSILFLFTIFFGVYGLLVKETFIVNDVYAYNYGEKNTLFVWCVLIGVDLIIGFLWIIVKIAMYKIYGKHIIQRIHESLIISESHIEYGYQNLIDSTDEDRVIVKVPIQDIQKIKINKLFSRVEIIGKINSIYYENYINKITNANENDFKDGSLILFDYFEPGILEYFEKNHREKMEEE